MSLQGRSVGLVVLGCRTNQYEGDALASALADRGAVLADPASGEALDAAILVTCTVTAVADRKVRQELRRLRRRHPRALLVATGCWAQEADPEEARGLGADLLVGNRLKSLIPDLLERRLRGEPVSVVHRQDLSRCDRWDPLVLGRRTRHTRAFVKVQDGCSHRCRYCIVPTVRGRSVSRPAEEVLGEVRRLAEQGCREVVLTGVHLGLYGRDRDTDLGDLVAALARVEGLKRLRFGSLEPFGLEETLLDRLADTGIFCPHLHLPLQSGDDGVLDRMGRGATAGDFAGLVEAARRRWGEDLHVSTDLLVGFPGEDEGAFRNTLTLVEDLGLGRLHVFPFSPRKGTPAASWPRPPAGEVRERTRRALDLGRILLDRFAARFLGRPVEVLVERCREGKAEGLTPSFVRALGRGIGPEGDLGVWVPRGLREGTLLEDPEDQDASFPDDVLP